MSPSIQNFFSTLAFSLIVLFSCAQQNPSVVQLTGKNEPGKPFTLSVTILDVDNKKAVAGVEVFAYHTNYKGNYEEDSKGVARIHGTAISDDSGKVKFITIYPRGYNDSPTGEHVHFRIKGTNVVASDPELMFSDFYDKKYDYTHPNTFQCYLKSLEEKNGSLYGIAIIYVKKKAN